MSQLEPSLPRNVNDDLPPHLQTIGAGLDFTDPNSPLAPYYLQTSDVVAAALLGMLFFFLNLVPLWHTDIWGHLKNGQYIVLQHSLPKQDVLCIFSDPQANSLHVYWLSQTAFYLVYQAGSWLAGGDALQHAAGGVELLRAFHALLVVARFALLFLALRRLGCSPALSCFGQFFLLLFSSGHIAILRPQIVGELFLTCVLLAVSRPILSKQALFLIPLVFVLWANCHGSFVVGLLVLGGCLFGEVVRLLLVQRSLDLQLLLQDVQVRRLAIVFGASILAIALLNPHGPYLYVITYQMSQQPNVMAMDEWQPIALTRFTPVLFIYGTTVLLVVIAQLLSQKWYSPRQWVLLLGIGVQPLLHQRMMVWWLLLLPWLILPQLTSALERLPYYWRPQPGMASFRKTVIAALLLAVFALWSAPGQWLVSGRPWALGQVVSQGTPWQLTRDLKQQGENKEDWEKALVKGLEAYPNKQYEGRIFASETLGDYFSWSLPMDRMPVYITSHVHLSTPEHWLRTVIVKRALPDWKKVLDGGQVNLVVVEPELHPLLRDALKQDADWQVLLDETGSPSKIDPRCRLLVALRKKPLL